MTKTLEWADQGADLLEEIEPMFEIGDMLFSLYSEPLKILDIKADTYVAKPDQPYYLVLNTLGFENKLYFDAAHRGYFKNYNEEIKVLRNEVELLREEIKVIREALSGASSTKAKENPYCQYRDIHSNEEHLILKDQAGNDVCSCVATYIMTWGDDDDI